MQSLQDTQLLSPKLDLVPPMSTIPLAMLLLNILKVKFSTLLAFVKFQAVTFVYHGMQVYKNTQGIMQQLLHQMNMEEVYCLTRLSFVPWRVVSNLYQLILVTVIKQHLCQYDLPFTSNMFLQFLGL